MIENHKAFRKSQHDNPAAPIIHCAPAESGSTSFLNHSPNNKAPPSGNGKSISSSSSYAHEALKQMHGSPTEFGYRRLFRNSQRTLRNERSGTAEPVTNEYGLLANQTVNCATEQCPRFVTQIFHNISEYGPWRFPESMGTHVKVLAQLSGLHNSHGTRLGLEASVCIGHNPVGVETLFCSVSQGSSQAATPGLEDTSLGLHPEEALDVWV